MKLKIFKTTLYAIIMVWGISTFTHAQDTPPSPAKEKSMDEKMKVMEQKLQVMQQKLDSMKQREVKVLRIDGGAVTVLSPKTVKGFKLTPAPSRSTTTKTLESVRTEGYAQSLTSGSGSLTTVNAFTYKGPDKAAKKLNYEVAEKKLEERIRSGEVKQKTKAYSKEYKINSGDKLLIDNRYGKVTVNTWNKNEFKVDVEMRGIANDDDDAQKLLDDASVTDDKDGSIVSFITKIESRNNSYSWGSYTNNGKSYVRKLEINYVITMPSKNALEIKNRFGAVTLPDFNGRLVINTQYCTLTTKDLTNANNEITTRFTDVDIESITGSELNCQYDYHGQGIKIGSANNLKFDAQFVDADIAKIKTAGNISMKYGSGLKINELDKNVKALNITSSFAPVILGPKNNFDFSVSVSFNTFKYDDDRVKIISKFPEDGSRSYSTVKKYTGYSGKSNTDTKVNITNTYKGIEFL